MHALALQRIWQLTPPQQRPEIRARIQALYPRLVNWHRYLATQRDPEASGLVTAYHPWEGTDNSPRWDRALARIEVAKPGPYTRLDTSELGDPAQRPTNWDYDRYLWLVEHAAEVPVRRRADLPALPVPDQGRVLQRRPRRGERRAARPGRRGRGQRRRPAGSWPAGWTAAGRGWRAASTPGPASAPTTTSAPGSEIRLRTFAAFAPLFARTADAGQRAAQLRLLDSADFCGNPRLRWPLLPSTSPAEPAFEPHNYWRGPVWPVINWLLWQSLTELGCPDRAAGLRRDSLAQLASAGEFDEYFDPFTGKPLGSPRQSWTAAVVLDWLASDHDGEGASAPVK